MDSSVNRLSPGETLPLPTRPSNGAAGPGADTSLTAACTVSEFASRSGETLVEYVRAQSSECINTLFRITGPDAHNVFNERNMVSVANAFAADAADYRGDNGARTVQLVLFLRAGYYVQYYRPSDVGSYGQGLSEATGTALDRFFASPRTADVSDANGEILAEAVTLIDSAELNHRHLATVVQLLRAYGPAHDASFWMLSAVNNTFTVLFRGHQLPAFVAATASDPTVLTTLREFAASNARLLGGPNAYLVTNAGRELARFLGDPSVKSTAKPLVIEVLSTAPLDGATAPLWVATAAMVEHFDSGACADYGTCDLKARVSAAVLPQQRQCGSTLTFRSQSMTDTEFATVCASLQGQDAYFLRLVQASAPVADDHNTSLEIVVFDSSRDYQSYAGALFDIETNNGGMYLEGNPATVGNQPRFIAYEADWLRPAFEIWNLNHEYTHYLDGRYNMYGDFTSNISTPTLWWIEGIAEYVSYGYRNLAYTAAQQAAAQRSYRLSELFDTSYAHDTERIYRWGYLAVAFMLSAHPRETQTVLEFYRSGQWSHARAYLTQSIGSLYDAEFQSFLQRCAGGACDVAQTAPTTPVPTTTASPPTPTPTVTAAPTAPGTRVECADPDTRVLESGCLRSNAAGRSGAPVFLIISVPAGSTSLTVHTEGGTGDVALYYSDIEWASPDQYVAISDSVGNGENVTIANPRAGYHFVTLVSDREFTGVTVRADY